MTDREFALDTVRKLQQAGFTALWAGGCVRDELLGLVPADYDIATNARPEQLRPLFRKRNEIGASFGVVQVIGPRGDDGEWLTIEVATFRSDGTYSDGRRPDAIVFSSALEDAKRRDFTVNGMFYDPVCEKLIDYVGGRADLDARILRAIGNPTDRFTEDKLRILRAVRMATRFHLTIDTETLHAAQRMAHEIRVVSSERIAEELRKTLVHPNRARGVHLLGEFGLVPPLFPELVGEPWEQGAKVIDRLGEPVNFPLALAALLHAHDGSTVETITERLKLATAEKTRILFLVEHQASLTAAATLRPSRLKPLLVHPGIAELLALHRAIALAEGKPVEHVEFCERVLHNTPAIELNPPPLVTGEDLITLGLKPGREFKRLLDAVREAQLDGLVTTKPQALELVRQVRS